MIHPAGGYVISTEDYPRSMPTHSPTDADLILAIREGDVQALEDFYDRHRVVAYSLALRILGSPSDAEDAVQEVFVNVWRSAATYSPERSSARSWFLSMVHHRCIDKVRGRQSRPRAVTMADDASFPARNNVWEEVLANLTHDRVIAALGALPRDQREVIEMAYFRGYTHTEIARRTGVPLGTVKGRIRLGLHRLKDLLAPTQGELAVD